jgi:hypothetical protein
MNDKKIPESGLSNHVLIFDSDDHKKVTLFLPAYMRFNFKKMTSIDIAETQARMSGALLLSIYYKGVTDDIVKRIESGIEVSLNQEEFHTISNNNPHHQKSGKMHITRDEDNWLIHATWRNQFPLELACKDVFYSPFSLIDLGFEVSLRSFKFVNSDNVKYSVKFNLMRLEPECGESIYQMFSVRKDDRGEYSVA